MNNIIVSPHYVSTDIASQIYNKGGNAVDAAIATNLIQGIVAPETCGIGGDLFALVWDPSKNEPDFLDASGYAGSFANPDDLQNMESIPLNHPISVTVPGAVAGWIELSKKYGNLKVEEILDLGIDLCHEGFEINEELYNSLIIHKEELSGQASGYGFYRDNQPFEKDKVIRRPQLGKTLEQLKTNGLEYFYDSEIAKSISSSVNGILSLDDLRNYKAEWKKPLHTNIYGFDGWTSPPPTQGYLTLSTLKAIEMLDAENNDIHKIIETYRIFAADRDNITYDYGKNIKDFKGVDLDYIQEKIKLFNPNHSKKFDFPKPHGGGTAYMNTIDKEGLGVSLIQSNFHGIGSRIGVGSFGFFLHNRGCGFNLDSKHPNYLKPGRKPLHTLSPTIWSKNGNLEFIAGTRGGRYQPQLLIQTILPYIQKSDSFEKIIKEPRWVIENFSSDTISKLRFEKINNEDLEILLKKGHEVEVENKLNKAYGPISIIYKKDDGNFEGVCDVRVGTEKVFNSF